MKTTTPNTGRRHRRLMIDRLKLPHLNQTRTSRSTSEALCCQQVNALAWMPVTPSPKQT